MKTEAALKRVFTDVPDFEIVRVEGNVGAHRTFAHFRAYDLYFLVEADRAQYSLEVGSLTAPWANTWVPRLRRELLWYETVQAASEGRLPRNHPKGMKEIFAFIRANAWDIRRAFVDAWKAGAKNGFALRKDGTPGEADRIDENLASPAASAVRGQATGERDGGGVWQGAIVLIVLLAAFAYVVWNGLLKYAHPPS